MTLPRRAITVVEGIAQLRSGPGPAVVEYVYPLDVARVFRWIPEDTGTDDGRTIVGVTGGFVGNYVAVRASSEKGADLTAAAAQTLAVGDGAWRVIQDATLTQTVVLTLSTTGAVEGDRIEVTRLDVGAFTVGFLNGGPAAGTLVTMPVSARSHVTVQFDGTDWELRRSGLML